MTIKNIECADGCGTVVGFLTLQPGEVYKGNAFTSMVCEPCIKKREAATAAEEAKDVP